MRPPTKPLPRNQEEFEAAVISSIFQSNPSFAVVLSEQIASADVIERWGSGSGFYIDYKVKDSVPKIPADAPQTFDSDVYAIEGVEANQGGGRFFHSNGLIECLECYGFGNGWPEDEYVYRFF
jgi:hypothetical protein